MNTFENLKKDLEHTRISDDDIQEIIDYVDDDGFNVETSKYLLVADSHIDDLAVELLESDTYTLGMCNAGLASNLLKIDEEAIKCLQDNDKYDLVGQMFIDRGVTSELVREMVLAYGYLDVFYQYESEFYFKRNDTWYYLFTE